MYKDVRKLSNSPDMIRTLFKSIFPDKKVEKCKLFKFKDIHEIGKY